MNIDRIDEGKIDALDSRIADLGLAVRRLDAAKSVIERLLAGVLSVHWLLNTLR